MRRIAALAALCSLLACAHVPCAPPHRFRYAPVWDHAVAAWRDAYGTVAPTCHEAWRNLSLSLAPAADVRAACARVASAAVGCTTYVASADSSVRRGPYVTLISDALTPRDRCRIAAHELLHVLAACNGRPMADHPPDVFGDRWSVLVDVEARSAQDCP